MMESSSSSQNDQPDGQALGQAPITDDRLPAPLVVIQYRSNPVPIILLSLGIIVLGLGGFAYHRRAVALLDRQAAQAATAVVASGAAASQQRLRATIEAADPADNLTVRKGMVEKTSEPTSTSTIAEPLALNSQPTPVPAAVAVKPADAGAKAVSVASASPAPIVDQAKVTPVENPEKPNVANRALDAGPIGPVATRTVVPSAKRLDADRAVLPDPGQADLAPRPELVLKPLPTKEETQREIENEANQKMAQISERERSQHEELQASRVESRSRFRKQLRELINEQGSRAGKAIDALSEQYREYVPPVVHHRASRIWSSSERSIDQRIQSIRAMGLPESLILDLMSDDFYQNLHARNGPRTKSEVRVRAAILLLKHDPEEIAAVTEQTPRPEPGANRSAKSRARPGIR
jgi:hypothetical protein